MRVAVVLGMLGLAATAQAQAVNVNFGPTDGAPASTYGAAGAVGTWNSISGIAGQTFEIVDLSGAATPITMSQSPTTTMLTTADASVSGDDAKLLNTGLDTTGAETCLAFNGFTAGMYEVLVYAWTPNAPSVLSRTRQDEAASTIDVGGAWTGAHVEGVTYARYVVTVGADGNLPAHSGLAPSQPSAALNGIQIRPLPLAVDAGPQPDAAGGGGGGGGGGETGDAGTTSSHHGGGCAAGGNGGLGSGALVLAIAALARRRNRTAIRRRHIS